MISLTIIENADVVNLEVQETEDVVVLQIIEHSTINIATSQRRKFNIAADGNIVLASDNSIVGTGPVAGSDTIYLPAELSITHFQLHTKSGMLFEGEDYNVTTTPSNTIIHLLTGDIAESDKWQLCEI